ncbi:MAG: TolC family protein [Planctomycetota bacterium]
MILLLGIPTTAMPQGSKRITDEAAELADAAVKGSPDITAVGTGIKALQQRVRGAGAWLDPVLSLGYQNMPVDRWAPGASPMSGIQLSLKQTFYWPGKIGAREKEAAALVTEQRQTLAERKVQLRATVKRAYYRLALVRQLRQVTSEHIKLVEQFIDVVRVKYEVGKLGQHDLLRLKLLLDKLSDNLGNFDRDDTALSAAINAALHRPAGVAIRTPSRITPQQLRTDAAGLFKAAVQRRPLLRRYQAQAAARRAAAARAAREGYPDISTWLGYTLRVDSGADPGTDFVSLGLSLPLSLSYGRRWGSLQREHELQAKQAEQERGAELDRIRGELGRVVAAWQRAVQQARAYRSKLTPDAHRTLDATFAAYQVGRADFASLFQAELQLLSFEETLRKAEATAALARVEIEALVGGPLDKHINEEK